jgi:hypothetical protein
MGPFSLSKNALRDEGVQVNVILAMYNILTEKDHRDLYSSKIEYYATET